MRKAYGWTGTIRKSGDGIAGLLTDTLGLYTIILTGVRGDGGYVLTGVPGPMPDSLSVPPIDEWPRE